MTDLMDAGASVVGLSTSTTRVESSADLSSITVLVPAHNEAASIGATLRGLRAQLRRPDRIVVVADNCTDDTVAIARRHQVQVVETVANGDKKAGALNQALAALLPGLTHDDAILVMDADTVLTPDFLSAAAERLGSDPALGAVGGIFLGERGAGLLGALQRNEYTRYSRDIARRKGRRVMVLTGTATLFRATALQQVARERGVTFPGSPGQVYDTLALTEDNEITLALKTLGWAMVSPQECRNTTELMPTVGDLWEQRLRWQRGALENLRHYGIDRVTVRYLLQQLGIGYGVVAFSLYVAMMLITTVAAGGLVLIPFWVLIGLIFAVERTVTVWRGGWLARLVAAPVFVELAYAAFLQAVFVRALFDIATGRAARWHHLNENQKVTA